MRNQIKINQWISDALPLNWVRKVRSASQEIEEQVETSVKEIIRKVRIEGDDALIDLTKKFDKVPINKATLRVSKQEFDAAYKQVNREQVASLQTMKEKLYANGKPLLQKLNMKTQKEGIKVETIIKPISSVGCYVPGGQASYPSTVIMTVVPAKVAGVPRIVVCSPPTAKGTVNSLILVAADICEVDEVYKIGGAQAVAALAYGTETIRPVNKIVGPGSRYVTAAKVQVSRDVAIDMPAGPSEVLVLADETADPLLVASDMISQAEHGADSVAGLMTTSQKLADEVYDCLCNMVSRSERAQTVEAALSKFGFIIICKNTAELVTLANIFAPEHLEIMTKTPRKTAEKISSAGLILIGSFSPVALSDYASGTNHVLPTGGFGQAFSGLSVLDFVRRVNVVESSKEGLLKVKNDIRVLTEAERLPGHFKAVEARFQN